MKLTKFLYLALLAGFCNLGFSQTAFDAIRLVQDEMGIGARSLAMGGAYAGLANDYSAIYWNPAGLASITKSEFSGEVGHLQFNNDALFKDQLTEDSQNYTQLRSLGFAFPLPTLRGSFVIGMGYNRVKDFNQNLLFSGFNNQSNELVFTIDDQDFAFDREVFQTERISDEGGLNQWSVAAALALSPNFNAGLTATFWTGESDYRFEFFQEDQDNVYSEFPSDFDSYQLTRNLQSDYSAVGLKLGGMFEVREGIKLGGAIGLPVTFNVEETFSEEDLLVFDDGFEDVFEGEPGQFEYDVKTPFHFDWGASFSNRDFTLAAGFRYRDWSQTKFSIDDAALGSPEYVDLLDENTRIREDFQATLEYKLGGELWLSGLNAKLRGGYALFPSPLENAPDEYDKQFLSGGVGFLIDRYVTLDIAYLRGSWERESEDSLTPGGTLEDITTHRILVSLNYRF